jgi:hypothetical protein
MDRVVPFLTDLAFPSSVLPFGKGALIAAAPELFYAEDTDGDGKADKETVFADNLYLPIGFEFAPEGVYLSQEPNLVLLRDTDGDDKADRQEIILGGFDTHDTHHAISAYTADPSGAFMLCEGVFLHSNVETPYGPVRCVDGGFFRYSPQRGMLERTIQMNIPNPWGYVFDRWGQDFFLFTSGTTMNWALPMQVKPTFGSKTPATIDLIPAAEKVRPTSGLEIISSRHFPDEVHDKLDLAAMWRHMGQPVVRDASASTWVLGTGPAQRASALTSLEAPDFDSDDDDYDGSGVGARAVPARPSSLPRAGAASASAAPPHDDPPATRLIPPASAIPTPSGRYEG